MLETVVKQMVKKAAEEINFEDYNGAYDLLVQNLYEKYEILLDDEPTTWQLMNLITVEIDEWQIETEFNFS